MIGFISIGSALLLAFFIYIAHKNTRQATLNHVRIVDVKQNGDGRGRRQGQGQFLNVLHLSDLHLENLSVSPEALYETVKDEPIDLIAITGDFLDRKRSIPKLISYLDILKRLEAKLGIYAVFGNHDYVLKDRDFASFRQVLKENGCKTLQNEHDAVVLDGLRVNIIGIDDYSTRRSDAAASFSGVEKGYRLVLTHDPNVVLELERYDFDYLLSGHFHGGQIYWPKPYHLVKMGKLVRMNMIKGLHFVHGKPFYISEGLGQTALNLRIGSRPEITLHHLFVPSAANEQEAPQEAV